MDSPSLSIHTETALVVDVQEKTAEVLRPKAQLEAREGVRGVGLCSSLLYHSRRLLSLSQKALFSTAPDVSLP